MSDATKLRPEDLTATVREMYPPPPPLAGWLGFYYDSGFYDSEQGKRADAGWYCSGKVHPSREEALCELAEFRPFEGSTLVEVGQTSALFSPAPSEAAKVEDDAHTLAHGRHCTCEMVRPKPEPAAPDVFATDRAIGALAMNAEDAPAAPEMPEAVRSALLGLRLPVNEGVQFTPKEMNRRADALESWWRNSAQPVKVRMTEELEYVLICAAQYASLQDREEDRKRIRERVVAVRQQAAQPRARLRKVRDMLNSALAQTTLQVRQDEFLAALAELDAHEGKGEGRG